jgi:hypothetical protein
MNTTAYLNKYFEILEILKVLARMDLLCEEEWNLYGYLQKKTVVFSILKWFIRDIVPKLRTLNLTLSFVSNRRL